ncbi:MAG: hypothetical protein L6R39_007112 [Caloplaca ligustica]|nr:MAG: hypothetical protein L6R39_007112 [Caloplaca ligustica]
MLWEHLTGGLDMYAVFDYVKKPGLGQSVSEKQILKLVHHGDLLEEIDLENVAYQVRVDEERFRSQQIQDSERFVVLMIRNPVVALRYQISTGRVRRVQMNFQLESSYDAAVRIFRSLGVPIWDKNVATHGSQDGAGKSLSPQHLQLPPPYQTAGGDTQMKIESYPGHEIFYRAGPPGLGRIPSFERPTSNSSLSYHSPMTSPPRGHFDDLRQSSQDLTLTTTPNFLQGPNIAGRATTSYGYSIPFSSAPERNLDRPATAPITLSQIMPPRRELPFPKQLLDSLEDRMTEGEGLDNIADTVDSQTTTRTVNRPSKGKAKGKTSRPSSSRAKPRPTSKQGPAKKVPQQLAPGPEIKNKALMTSEMPTFDNLPSKRTDSGHLAGEASKRNTEDQLSRPPSSRARTRSATKSGPANEQRQPLAPGLEPANEEVTTMDIVQAPAPPAKKNIAKRAMTEADPSKTNVRKKAPAMAKKPPTDPEQFAKDFENISPEEYMDRLDHWVRKYRDLPTPNLSAKPTSTDKDQLAAYAAQPEEERLAALDSMTCEYLEDENFIKLVEDMDKTWSRIGLGF